METLPFVRVDEGEAFCEAGVLVELKRSDRARGVFIRLMRSLSR